MVPKMQVSFANRAHFTCMWRGCMSAAGFELMQIMNQVMADYDGVSGDALFASNAVKARILDRLIATLRAQKEWSDGR